jgi:hypothetical protein
MVSGHAKGRGILGLCCLAIGLLHACTTGPVDIEELPRLQLGYPSATGPPPIVATKAAIATAGWLRINYLDGDREVSASVPVFAQSTTDPAHRKTAPPVIGFEPSELSEPLPPSHGKFVSIRSVEEWHELIEQLEHEVAALVPGQGVVLDILQQEDVFLYVDDSGSLHAIPIEDKPTKIEPVRTVTLTELLEQAVDKVRHSLQQQSGGSRYLLFNTGDSPDTGFPFVFMDLALARVFFIQRRGKNHHLLAYGPAGSARAALHVLNSQAKSIAMSPLSTLARMVSSFGTTLLDSVHPTPTWAYPEPPPLPLQPAAYMDPEAWEVDYKDLIHDPGDAVVTRDSLLGRSGHGLQLISGYDAPPALTVSCTVLLSEQHQFLTGNPTFQNNLLHTLFNPGSG